MSNTKIMPDLYWPKSKGGTTNLKGGGVNALEGGVETQKCITSAWPPSSYGLCLRVTANIPMYFIKPTDNVQCQKVHPANKYRPKYFYCGV